MDVYNLINSKAISNYCRKINHSFTSLEISYLIYSNNSMTIFEKQEAFKNIISMYPDMEVCKRPLTPHFDSLHSFLENYIQIQNKYLSVFYMDEPNRIYSFEILYFGDNDYTQYDRIYSNFALCYNSIKSEIDEMIDFYKQRDMEIYPIDIRIKKQWINIGKSDELKRISVCIDYNNNPTEIWDVYNIVNEEESDLFFAFEGMWFEIPTPFEKGDILIAKHSKIKCSNPIILDCIPYWDNNGKNAQIIKHLRESGDVSDLITSVYGQDENGGIWKDHGPSYLDLEYCDKELCGAEKILLVLSEYLKGRISLDMFLSAYDILRCEQFLSKERNNIYGSTAEILKNVGKN